MFLFFICNTNCSAFLPLRAAAFKPGELTLSSGELIFSLCQSDASFVLITAEEQREPPPPLNNAGPHSFRRGSATFALTHYLSEETGPVGDIQGPLPPAGADLFFEGLIGKEAERVTTKERQFQVKHNDAVSHLCLPTLFFCFLNLTVTYLCVNFKG